MNIHQMSVLHDERQDRLLLRLNTQDQKEFRFWLTRRLTMRLIPVVKQSAARLEAAQPGVAATDSRSQSLLSEFKREAFLEKADFQTPFDTQARQWPLGPEPMLITDVHLSIQPGDVLEMTFEDKSDPPQVRSCRLNLRIDLLHGMVHLIEQAFDKAQWGSGVSPDRPVDLESAASQDPPRYAH
jgi:hypothetical protein